MQTITPIKSGAFLNSSKRLTELTRIRTASITLLKYKKDRLKLELKYKQTRDKFEARQNILDREKAQERKKQKTIKSRLARKSERAASGGLLDLLFTFAKLKVLLWAADPKNVKALQGLFEFFKGLFKVIDFFATIGVEGLLGGLGDLVSPDSTNIQRLFAVFKIFGGFFILSKMLRWSNPFNAIKDLQRNKGIISKIFKSLGSRDFKSALDGIKKLLTPQLFRKGLGQSIQRVILKVFGKGGLKAVQALATRLGFKTAQQLVKGGIAKGASAIGKRIPLIGPFIGLGINLLMGVPLDVSAVRFAGAVAGEWIGRLLFGLLGAFLGSVIPGAGTALGGAAGLAVGGFIGNLIGEWLSDLIYGGLKSLFGGKKKEEPALAVGGIVTKPTRALIGEAGPEAVIPLGQIYNGSILNAPLGIVASSMIGGIDALITSMGPVGLSFRPFASQLLAPYAREFGKENYTFSSNLAKKSGATIKASPEKDTEDQQVLSAVVGTDLPLTIIDKKQDEKQDRYNTGFSVREILADILNNIINLDFRDGGGGPGGGGGGGGGTDQALTAADLDAIKASSADKRAAAHLATLEASAPQHVADVYQVILNRAAKQSGGIPAVITAKEQFSPYSAALYGSSADGAAARKYGGLGLTKKELFDLAGKSDGIQQLTSRFQAGNPRVAAQVLADFEKNGPLSQNAKKFVGGAQYFMGYKVTSNDRRRSDGGNWFRDRYQTGGVVATQGVGDTGPGYTIQGATDQRGRPIVFSQAAASAFAKMMKDSGGVVKASDVASSKRSLKKNSDVGGASKSKHLYGIAMDIHGSSEKWIRKNGAKYGWIVNDYPGSHGGHFEFGGPGIKPSDAQQQQSSPGNEGNQDTSEPPNWDSIATELGNLYKLLNPSAPSVDSQSLASQSMDFLQSSKLDVKLSDTYIISQGSTLVSSFNVLTPLPQADYSTGGFSHMDSSAYQLQSRL